MKKKVSCMAGSDPCSWIILRLTIKSRLLEHYRNMDPARGKVAQSAAAVQFTGRLPGWFPSHRRLPSRAFSSAAARRFAHHYEARPDSVGDFGEMPAPLDPGERRVQLALVARVVALIEAE
ncbi:MAG: hypothetical protein R3D56_03410 [Paracoccaceae bacterium]